MNGVFMKVIYALAMFLIFSNTYAKFIGWSRLGLGNYSECEIHLKDYNRDLAYEDRPDKDSDAISFARITCDGEDVLAEEILWLEQERHHFHFTQKSRLTGLHVCLLNAGMWPVKKAALSKSQTVAGEYKLVVKKALTSKERDDAAEAFFNFYILKQAAEGNLN